MGEGGGGALLRSVASLPACCGCGAAYLSPERDRKTYDLQDKREWRHIQRSLVHNSLDS